MASLVPMVKLIPCGKNHIVNRPSLVDLKMKKSEVIEKRYIVRKFILAKSASDALKKERKFKADECWVDEEFEKEKIKQNPSAIGFAIPRENEDDW